VKPTACDLRVGSDACNVNKRYFEAALERTELVSAPDVQRQLAFRYRQIDQRIAPVLLAHINHDCNIEAKRYFFMCFWNGEHTESSQRLTG
jgi:hypothetical protein